MRQLTDEGERALSEIATRHGVSTDAAQHLLLAVVAGHMSQAQFNHPELGGMGQWSQGGMIMVGDMFNNGLKAKVDALCTELAALARGTDLFRPLPPPQFQSQVQGSAASLFVPRSFGNWWPEGLGHAASTGSQNNLRYAFFPETRRLAIDLGGKVKIYDTHDHRIGGFSQQQSGDQSLSFTSQHGLIDLASLEEVDPVVEHPEPRDFGTVLAEAFAGEAPHDEPPRTASADDDIIGKIEKLAGLHAKGILTDEEFQSKKTDLLSRL
ncbi:SHOCT domain-containing protein [Rhizobium sp. LjRoot254]|uniref:SHOCT domain-containing protein n=1 Tax=Rhizobium sp. LjRoot254 TaxID=3342297 RepID=UPI003ECF561E